MVMARPWFDGGGARFEWLLAIDIGRDALFPKLTPR